VVDAVTRWPTSWCRGACGAPSSKY